ncbi:MAG: tetratricopeptide repeat protein [Gemmatimonadota bacterium]|nr:tetratricopeptide repeat protein [Gemmatimonadota bacterium]MDE2871060.1 tetratricopeptide repeat protein [Gemmatimonadota bacterium]
MRSRLRIGIVGVWAFASLLGPLAPVPASGQASERLKVMVTNLVPLDGADDDFGKDLAKALRELINDFARHQAVEEKEIRDAAKKFDLKMEELDCVRSLQMVGQGIARITFCGSYTEDREAKTFTLKGVQFVASGAAPLEIPDKTWHRDDYRSAAQEIAAKFDEFVTQLTNARFCAEDYEMENWDAAESRCVVALRISPNDAQVRLIYAQVLRRTERPELAYEEVLKVLEIEPMDNTALQLAGFLAAILDHPEEAREHFNRLLQLDPGNVPVRLKIAYEVAQEGQPRVAMLIAEEGLALEPDNIDLLKHHASFAIRSGQDLQVEGQPLSLETAEFFKKGVESYNRVYEMLGSEMESSHLSLMIGALNALERLDQALDLADKALETHGDEAKFWSTRGDILNKLGRVDDALASLDEAEIRDPTYPNIRARQGSWLLRDGREEAAFPLLMEAVEKGEQPATSIASLFFGVAVSKGIQPKEGPKNPQFALRMLEMAKTFESELPDRMRGQLDYFQAYSLYLIAELEQKPETVQSAQRTLPKFREVVRLLGLPHVVDYARASQAKHLQQLSDNTQQFIAIQKAVIQKG